MSESYYEMEGEEEPSDLFTFIDNERQHKLMLDLVSNEIGRD